MTNTITLNDARDMARAAQALTHARSEVIEFAQTLTRAMDDERNSRKLADSFELLTLTWRDVENVIYRANNRHGLQIVKFVEDTLDVIWNGITEAKASNAFYEAAGGSTTTEAIIAREQVVATFHQINSVLKEWSEYSFDYDLLSYLR